MQNAWRACSEGIESQRYLEYRAIFVWDVTGTSRPHDEASRSASHTGCGFASGLRIDAGYDVLRHAEMRYTNSVNDVIRMGCEIIFDTGHFAS